MDGDEEGAPPILICVLGDFRVLKAGQPVALCGGAKAEALLCLLALHGGRSVPRDTLLCALWPGQDVELAGQSLHSLVYHLHKLLGDALGGAAPVVSAHGSYRLNSEAGVDVDMARFVALADAGDRHERTGDGAAAISAYRRALQLYRGDLSACAGADGYAAVAREALRSRYRTLRARLAAHYFDVGDYTASLEQAWRLLLSDPYREDARRLMMRCYVRRGERARRYTSIGSARSSCAPSTTPCRSRPRRNCSSRSAATPTACDPACTRLLTPAAQPHTHLRRISAKYQAYISQTSAKHQPFLTPISG